MRYNGLIGWLIDYFIDGIRVILTDAFLPIGCTSVSGIAVTNIISICILTSSVETEINLSTNIVRTLVDILNDSKQVTRLYYKTTMG
jgi:hypothetical protein